MNVAWAMLWGGSRNTKPCVFPCKVAAAGDERYLVCAALVKKKHEGFKLREETGECESEQDECIGCCMFPVM